MKISRGYRKAGEVFAMNFDGVGYIYGRVVRENCAFAPSPDSPEDGPWPADRGVYLVYIYNTTSRKLNVVPKIKPSELMLPPKLIIRAGWTHGYFVTVRHDVLTPEDILPQHCFWDARVECDGREFLRYGDELGRRLPKRVEPCDERALGSFGSIAIDIAKALGLPYRVE